MKFWEFKAAANKRGELYLYGPISDTSWFEDDVTPTKFQQELTDLGDIDVLDIYFNSPGGDVFAATAIISILERHNAETIGHNDGVVASAAFYLYQAMNKRITSPKGLFMTHNASCCACGGKDYLRKMADALGKIDEQMAKLSAEKSGKPIDEVIKIQDAESWYSGTEAVAEGFADEVEEKQAKIAACTDIDKFFATYQHPPKIEKPEEQPDNGAEMQPVADNPTPKAEEAQPDALKEQRNYFNKLKRKLLEV
jgi:ATP-dependent Clp protease protease subunit